MIIAIEGIDASGKNTQVKRIAESVKAPHVISFPRYEVTPLGSSIMRELKEPTMSPAEFQALMLADKYDAAIEIHEANKKGKTVILDRYWMSAVVYGGADGLDVDWLENIHKLLPQPDHWFLLDIPVEVSVTRRPERRDAYEKNLDKLKNIRQRYLGMFEYHHSNSPNKWHILDGVRSAEVITTDILSTIRP